MQARSPLGALLLSRSDVERLLTPDACIATAEDFKHALLEAKVIVYANPAGGGAAGVHIARSRNSVLPSSRSRKPSCMKVD